MRLAILDRSVSVASRRGIVADIVADAMANRCPMNRNRAAKLHKTTQENAITKKTNK